VSHRDGTKYGSIGRALLTINPLSPLTPTLIPKRARTSTNKHTNRREPAQPSGYKRTAGRTRTSEHINGREPAQPSVQTNARTSTNERERAVHACGLNTQTGRNQRNRAYKRTAGQARTSVNERYRHAGFILTY
jgi:hypothetical protein